MRHGCLRRHLFECKKLRVLFSQWLQTSLEKVTGVHEALVVTVHLTLWPPRKMGPFRLHGLLLGLMALPIQRSHRIKHSHLQATRGGTGLCGLMLWHLGAGVHSPRGPVWVWFRLQCTMPLALLLYAPWPRVATSADSGRTLLPAIQAIIVSALPRSLPSCNILRWPTINTSWWGYYCRWWWLWFIKTLLHTWSNAISFVCIISDYNLLVNWMSSSQHFF